MSSSLPTKMKAWLYTSTSGGLEKNLYFDSSARAPPSPRPNDVLVQVLFASINPADYKVPAMAFGLAAKLVVGLPASPGMDFCGRVIATGANVSQFTSGQLVFGCHSQPVKFGSLAEYLSISADLIAAVPGGVSPGDAATIGIAGQSAFQAITGYVKEGDKVFINGGSGGCGLFEIQIAKNLGCHVTATCSTRNVELCREFGADEVIDYTTVPNGDLSAALRERGVVFDHIFDHVGLPYDLYFQCHHFLKPSGVFLQVGASGMSTHVSRVGWPSILGGGRRKYRIFFFANTRAHVVAIGEMLQKKSLKVNVDTEYTFEDAVKAFEKLCSGRARGKILIRVAE
ncbi:Polyketide synthase enoylreductase [Penicillium malachiteum]|uniref:Polyketide synthase enoylreductase n=1 Tax=Penicillium malachiteum TaxID=1324776 RepID=A0AAD6HGK6_9EURO|nr:Polyketide synthase enoylreductase [Penicillium malachiteum]